MENINLHNIIVQINLVKIILFYLSVMFSCILMLYVLYFILLCSFYSFISFHCLYFIIFYILFLDAVGTDN